jgi:AcrR family transcriptional regulator
LIVAMPERDSESSEPLYPKLSGRAAEALGARRVAAHQRGRLQGAMVEAVERRGYAAVTVSELVSLAGVSKSVFYRHFADKEDCFLETYSEIVKLGTEQIVAAYGGAVGVEGRLRAAFGAFIALATAYGPAGRFVFLASLELGPAAMAIREKAGERFESVLAEALAEPGERPSVSPLLVRALIGGTREVVYRRLEAGEPERLAADVETLVEWGLAYSRAAGQGSAGERLVTTVAGSRRAAGEESSTDWEEPPASTWSRRSLSQRERIIRASAQLAAEDGYAALTVGSISSRAGTSNQTFYENFDSKEEAFLAAFDALGQVALARTAAAFGRFAGLLESGTSALVALLEHFAAEPMHRRLVFFELPAAGATALARAEAMVDVLIAFLEPQELPEEVAVKPPRVVLEAIAGGVWAVCEHEVTAGRGDSLPEVAAELVDFILVPFCLEG